MKAQKNLYLILLVFIFSCSESFEKEVTSAVQKQINTYPESRLQDLYKNFFQDRYGPGHLISDSTMAGEYLRQELESYASMNDYPMIELIGWEGNFYRVSTDILKMDLVPYSVYLEAFIESANTTPETPIDEWKIEWNKILSVIDKMDLKLTDYESDKVKIQKLLDAGEYAVHHSEAFEAAYQPHYRIIKKEIFLEKIKPLLENQN
jgi:hypothetical protein